MRENWRELVMNLVMLEGALLLMMIFFTMVTRPAEGDSLDVSEFQVEGAKVLFTVFGCIAGSMMFGGMSTPRQRLSVLMTPASALEKYAARWVTYVIGYILAFVILFVAADVLNYVIFRVFVHSDNFIPAFLGTLRPECYDGFYWGIFGGIYLIFTSLFALGSILWPRKALLKTFFTLAVIVIVYWMIAYWTISIVPAAASGGGYIISNVQVTAAHINNIAFTGALVMAILLYVLTYYRFKESEIIDRW